MIETKSTLFDVYPRFNITPVKAEGSYVWDENGQQYLDLYGGHGVISIGHTHPKYVSALNEQLSKIGFYSNSVGMPIQEELASKLTQLSAYENYKVFLSNSGAEANENALKLASFHTKKKKVIAYKGSFHGRTAATLNVTDNPKISAPLNVHNFPVDFIELNNEVQFTQAIKGNDVCAVIIEPIQGVGGLDMPTDEYLQFLSATCKTNGIVLIVDEIQSGYGRSGKFFAHQYSGIKADIITTAKGMGNGFPIGGVLISPEIKASYGLLGTTFGGNHLACAAGIAVLEVLNEDKLMDNTNEVSLHLIEALKTIPQIKKIKGKGLMLGVEFDYPVKELRTKLLNEHHIFFI